MMIPTGLFYLGGASWNACFSVLTGLPLRVLSTVPLVVALLSALRRGARALPWTDRTGLGVCLVSWAASGGSMLAIRLNNSTLPWFVQLGIDVVPELFAWTVSYALVVLFGPAVARWFLPDIATAKEIPSCSDPYAPPTS